MPIRPQHVESFVGHCPPMIGIYYPTLLFHSPGGVTVTVTDRLARRHGGNDANFVCEQFYYSSNNQRHHRWSRFQCSKLDVLTTVSLLIIGNGGQLEISEYITWLMVAPPCAERPDETIKSRRGNPVILKWVYKLLWTLSCFTASLLWSFITSSSDGTQLSYSTCVKQNGVDGH